MATLKTIDPLVRRALVRARETNSAEILSIETVGLRLADVPRATIYRWIDAGLLPPPIRVGPRRVGIPADEVDAVVAVRRAGGDDEDVRELVRALIELRLDVRSPAEVADAD